MLFLALIGDLRGSSQIPPGERPGFQRDFCSTVEGLRKAAWRSEGDCVSPFTVTLGDEFQAVYADASWVAADCWSLWSDLGARDLRIALGAGMITTDINPDAAIGMDGPAFHAAREAMEQLKRSDATFALAGPTELVSDLTAFGDLIGSLTRGLDRSHLRVLLGLMQGQTQAVIARELEVSPQATSKLIERNSLRELAGAGRALGEELTRRLKGTR